jgi:hypothetical protein
MDYNTGDGGDMAKRLSELQNQSEAQLMGQLMQNRGRYSAEELDGLCNMLAPNLSGEQLNRLRQLIALLK